jgi:nucleotide-binding universal stress UspA family protein
MKSKVLIPVDTARNSLTAEEYAVKLNWLMPLRVTLLNVLNTTRIQQRGISPDDQARIKEGMKKHAESVLADAAAPFEKGQVEYETLIKEGSPAVAICKVAEEGGFDMVILPQSGFSELEEILGGSVVHNVLWKCSIPVLLVKHSKERLENQRNRLADR